MCAVSQVLYWEAKKQCLRPLDRDRLLVPADLLAELTGGEMAICGFEEQQVC